MVGHQKAAAADPALKRYALAEIMAALRQGEEPLPALERVVISQPVHYERRCLPMPRVKWPDATGWHLIIAQLPTKDCEIFGTEPFSARALMVRLAKKFTRTAYAVTISRQVTGQPQILCAFQCNKDADNIGNVTGATIIETGRPWLTERHFLLDGATYDKLRLIAGQARPTESKRVSRSEDDLAILAWSGLVHRALEEGLRIGSLVCGLPRCQPKLFIKCDGAVHHGDLKHRSPCVWVMHLLSAGAGFLRFVAPVI